MIDFGAPVGSLRPDEAALVCRIARDRGGLAISPDKLSLLEQRLQRRLRATGHQDFRQYISDLLRRGPGMDGEIQAMLDSLTTHTTGFFRETAQFDWLRQTGLPQRIEDGAGREWPMVVWSAACSTGAEMWSVAMILDHLSLAAKRTMRWRVIGSDLSVSILARARAAIFAESEIGGIPDGYRRRYLLRSRQPHGSGYLYRITPDLRSKARLYHSNLVTAAPALDTPVDVAMLRNVLIYFDESGRAAAVRNVTSRIAKGGLLLTGHSESLNPVPFGLTQVAPSIYRKG